MIYSSKSNNLIKSVIDLKDKKHRKEQEKYIVSGKKMVNEAILSGQKITLIISAESFSEAINAPCEKITVTDSLFKSLTDDITPQGILAVIKIPESRPPSGKSAILLDGISDPGNFGTIVRTAAASGYKDIILKNCVDAYNPKCVRASMSGIFFVNFIAYEDYENFPKDMSIIVADMSGKNVFSFNAPKEYILVIGNEANGVSEEIRKKATDVVKIPMESHSESLNAAVSAGILMYNLKVNKFKEN